MVIKVLEWSGGLSEGVARMEPLFASGSVQLVALHSATTPPGRFQLRIGGLQVATARRLGLIGPLGRLVLAEENHRFRWAAVFGSSVGVSGLDSQLEAGLKLVWTAREPKDWDQWLGGEVAPWLDKVGRVTWLLEPPSTLGEGAVLAEWAPPWCDDQHGTLRVVVQGEAPWLTQGHVGDGRGRWVRLKALPTGEWVEVL